MEEKVKTILKQCKPIKKRTKMNKAQTGTLEEFFLIMNYPSKSSCDWLSKQTSLPRDVIRKWFQNRRMKERIHCRELLLEIDTPSDEANEDLDFLLDVLMT
jgi:hypothetical protein